MIGALVLNLLGLAIAGVVLYVSAHLALTVILTVLNAGYSLLPVTTTCRNCGRASTCDVYCPSCNYTTLGGDPA